MQLPLGIGAETIGKTGQPCMPLRCRAIGFFRETRIGKNGYRYAQGRDAAASDLDNEAPIAAATNCARRSDYCRFASDRIPSMMPRIKI